MNSDTVNALSEGYSLDPYLEEYISKSSFKDFQEEAKEVGGI